MNFQHEQLIFNFIEKKNIENMYTYGEYKKTNFKIMKLFNYLYNKSSKIK